MTSFTLTLGLARSDRAAGRPYPLLALGLLATPSIFLSSEKPAVGSGVPTPLKSFSGHKGAIIPNHIDNLSSKPSSRGDLASSMERANLHDTPLLTSSFVRYMACGSLLLLLASCAVVSDRLEAYHILWAGPARRIALLNQGYIREFLARCLDVLSVEQCICLTVMLDIVWMALRLVVSIWPVWKPNQGLLARGKGGRLIRVSYHPVSPARLYSSSYRPRIHLLGGTSLTITTSYMDASAVNLVLVGMDRLDVLLSHGALSFTVVPELSASQGLEVALPKLVVYLKIDFPRTPLAISYDAPILTFTHTPDSMIALTGPFKGLVACVPASIYIALVFSHLLSLPSNVKRQDNLQLLNEWHCPPEAATVEEESFLAYKAHWEQTAIRPPMACESTFFRPELGHLQSDKVRREPVVRPGYGVYHPRSVPMTITEERRLERAQSQQLIMERIERKLQNQKLQNIELEGEKTGKPRRRRQRAGRQVRERKERKEAERLGALLALGDGSSYEEMMEQMEVADTALVGQNEEETEDDDSSEASHLV
ncbi:hypothetical protein BDV93DRAFT_547432, partial [Ceratobasidium sp. AG-I]